MYALRWCDIDLDAGNISINKQYTSKDGVGAPKNRENRIVPISSDLKELLTELKLKGGFKEEL